MKKQESIEDFLKRGGKIRQCKRYSKSDFKKNRDKAKKVFKERRVWRRKKVKETAKRLQKDPPKSDMWFQTLYESHKLKSTHDGYNRPFRRKYIPDVLNKKYRYIIEVDGSIHDTQSKKLTDIVKNGMFFKWGFHVIRVKAYDIESYIQAIETILKIRKWQETPEFIQFKLDYHSNKL